MNHRVMLCYGTILNYNKYSKGMNIENALKEVGLLLENCRGQGYDGVSAMSSESKSVSGRILQQNPKALMVVISL